MHAFATVRALAVTTVVALTVASCGADDGATVASPVASSVAPTNSSEPPAAGPTSTTPAVTRPAGAPASLDAFCAAADQGEVPEDYLGSAAHLADLDALLDLAPDEIREAVTVYRDFVASGGLTRYEDANLIENFPPRVRSAVSRIQGFVTSNC